MSLLISGGRLPGGIEADVLIEGGRIVQVGGPIDAPGAEVLDARDGFIIPGLWDTHVHFGQWTRSRNWIDIPATASPESVCAVVAVAVADGRDERPVVGFGHRTAGWSRPATVEELDAVSGDRPVFLISGDAHNGWLNSAALRLMGEPPRPGTVDETQWFALLARISNLPGTRPSRGEELAAVSELAARGLVGIVDLEFSDAVTDWPLRIADGIDALRVRAGVYGHQLEQVLAAGLRTGDDLPGGNGIATMGPVKAISDGSMSTSTAWCDAAPPAHAGMGAPNISPQQLRELLHRATAAGLEVAVHAIGDLAVASALDAFAATGARGSIEHAQLLRLVDVPRFAQLGVTAGMQPAHLLDDRDLADALWGGATSRAFMARSLLDAGARLALGSDAPVSEPDPWQAMAAAVWRSGDERPAWHQEQAITAAEALAASVDGRRLEAGGPGDVVVVESDPLAPGLADEVAHRLRTMAVRATVCAGRVTFGA